MAKYTVIAASVGGTRNRIFEFGDQVDDDCFPTGHGPKLVEQGFLKLVEPNADVSNLTPAQLLKLQEQSHEDAVNAGDVADEQTAADPGTGTDAEEKTDATAEETAEAGAAKTEHATEKTKGSSKQGKK